MTRKSRRRRRIPRFLLEHSRHGTRNAWSAMGLALVLTCFISIFRTLAGACLDLAFLGRTKGNASASSHGKADGDRLLRRSGPMLAMANFVDLFANEFACL